MISGIIMASGFSNRMGQNKLLMEIQGQRVIERVIRACKNSLLDEIILVYRLDEIREIGLKYDLKTVFNPHAEEGQSAAVKLGVKNSKEGNGFMFLVADQPYLDSQVINTLIREYENEQNMIVVPYYCNKFGMPIIFPPAYKADLLGVLGDKGGREIIERNKDLIKRIDYEEEILGIDIDTIEDYNRMSFRTE